jgi:hypothetical protein
MGGRGPRDGDPASIPILPVASEPASAECLVAAASHGPDLLHVGSNIPRKRIDVLLEVFAAIPASIRLPVC